ncbi:DUF3300 domain-containing protein [Lacimicrobium alkaliphilum]|uniref:DUF3300 domain-containing protein n=1 Tax=Lacimicrobium alkaliphilum TaxID=1526571 RepID=A0ABQ1RQT2_9ALTE|nr:DUF3300 domain-containing protein [Lacimicrobium alkaliphilum]GGD74976.1 hypothetical protein GCM10011357_32450 [Lacimicrobium alkaliphilum]
MPTLPYWKAHLRLLIILLLALCVASVTQAAQTDEQPDEALLDSLLAPVALYPDTLLSHILIAASYPLEVVQASRWRAQHQDPDQSDIIDKAEDQEWDPSVKALLPFDDILSRMSEDLQWTQNLGEAFIADEELVLARIQVLRRKAYDAGNLYSNENVAVEPEPEVIRIETIRKEVVYVPYYDTRTVYGDWWWAHHTPHYWHNPYAHASVNIFWGPRITVRPYFYFSNFHWQNHHIVVNRPHFYKRPRYYPRHTVIIRDGKRWHHEQKHRRGVQYKNPVVHRKVNNQRVSLSRESQQHPVRVLGAQSRAVRSKESVRHHQAVQHKLHKQSKTQRPVHKYGRSVEQSRNKASDTVKSPTQRAIRQARRMRSESVNKGLHSAKGIKRKPVPAGKTKHTATRSRSQVHSRQRPERTQRLKTNHTRTHQSRAAKTVQHTKPSRHIRNNDKSRIQKH